MQAHIPQKVKSPKGPACPSKRAKVSVSQLCIFPIELANYVASVFNIFYVGYC